MPYQDEGDVIRLPSIKHFNNTDFSLPLPVAFRAVFDFQARKYDIVHVHHPFLLGEMGLRLARRERIPLIFTYHTQYEKYTHYVPFDHGTAEKAIVNHTAAFCRLCDLVIAPTTDVRKLLEKRSVDVPIAVLPTGVELELYQKIDSKKARDRLGFSAETPILLYVGRLALEKNLEYLVSACLKVLDRHRNAHLLIVGDGQSRQELQTLAAEDGRLAQRVHFFGKIEGAQLLELYSTADLFVFASHTETQGMVIVEAMAGGTPAVCLDADGVRDIVINGENGILLPQSATSENFAGAVSACLNSPEKRNSLIQGANKTAKKYDMRRLAGQLHELYRMLKLMPNHRRKTEMMSFGLIRSYFETVWERLGESLARI